MSLQRSRDFGRARAVASRALIRRLARAVRRRTRESGIAQVANMVSLAFGWAFLVFAALMLVAVVLRPLTPAYEQQVAVPAVFGFTGLSLFLISLVCMGPYSGEQGDLSGTLANTPAPARLVYLLSIRRSRRTALKVLIITLLLCFITAAGVVILSGRQSSFWRVPWGAVQLMVLVWLPASWRRARRLWLGPRRTYWLPKARGGWQAWKGLGGLAVVAVCLAAAGAGDQIALWLHVEYPALFPEAGVVGHALGWLPHAAIFRWLGGGPFPWAAGVFTCLLAGLVAGLARHNLKDYHLDEGLDEDPARPIPKNRLGSSPLENWAAAIRGRVMPQPLEDEEEGSEDKAPVVPLDRDSVARQIREIMQKQGQDHPAAKHEKYELRWLEYSTFGWRSALLWGLAVPTLACFTVFCALHSRPAQPDARWNPVFLAILADLAAMIWTFVLLGGWRYQVLLPNLWQKVPVSIEPCLAETFEFDRRQGFRCLLWLVMALTSLAVSGRALFTLFPDLPAVRVMVPYAGRWLAGLTVSMTAITALVRSGSFQLDFLAQGNRRALGNNNANSGGGTGCSMLGQGLLCPAAVGCYAWGVYGGPVWTWPAAVVLVAAAERLRLAACHDLIRLRLFGGENRWPPVKPAASAPAPQPRQ